MEYLPWDRLVLTSQTGLIPDQEGSLEEGMGTHSNIFAWRIPWAEEPSRLQSTESQSVRHNWSDLVAAAGVVMLIDNMRKKKMLGY